MKKHAFENEFLFCEESVNNLNSHALKRHISYVFKCSICKEDYTTADSIKNHYLHHHAAPENNMFKEIETAFNRRVTIFFATFLIWVLPVLKWLENTNTAIPLS